MRHAITVLLVIVLGCLAARAGSFPEQEFAFTPGPGFTPSVLDEQTRVQALQALAKPNRDELLDKLVPNRIIAGEKWYDLRGITVRSGELSGSANLSQICWDHAHFVAVDLSDANLEGVQLRGCKFENVNLIRAQLDRSHLESSAFDNCRLEQASFKMAIFDGQSSFIGCAANNADFQNARGTIQFDNSSLQGAVFKHCKLNNAEFNSANLTGSDFEESSIQGVRFRRSVIDGIDLTDADMQHAEFDKVVLVGPLRLVRTKLLAPFFGDLDFSKVDISYVEWQMHDYRLGEELSADESTKSPKEKVRDYSQAEVIYKTLGEKYRQSGHVEEYLRIRFRAFETRRKLLCLDRDGRWSAECLWLNVSRFLDCYGTDFSLLLMRFLSTIALFSIIYYAAWARFGDKWFHWYRTQPQGIGLLKDLGADYVQVKNQSPHSLLKNATGNWGRVVGHARLLLISIGISLEASFMFAERFFNIPNILHLFRKREERPVPVRWPPKCLFGIQAVCGLVFVFLVGRIILLLISG